MGAAAGCADVGAETGNTVSAPTAVPPYAWLLTAQALLETARATGDSRLVTGWGWRRAVGGDPDEPLHALSEPGGAVIFVRVLRQVRPPLFVQGPQG